MVLSMKGVITEVSRQDHANLHATMLHPPPELPLHIVLESNISKNNVESLICSTPGFWILRRFVRGIISQLKGSWRYLAGSPFFPMTLSCKIAEGSSLTRETLKGSRSHDYSCSNLCSSACLQDHG